MIKRKKKKKSRRSKEINRSEYRKWRLEVLSRDNKQCVICGATKRLHCHHIHGFSAYVNLRYEVSNGATLCIAHHKKFHHIFGNRKFTATDFEQFKKMERR